MKSLDPSLQARRLAIVVAIAAALLGAARIASTWRVFSQTADEPAHLAAGFEWLAKGRYHADLEHPPLARIFFAVPFVVAGAGPPPASIVDFGNALLYRDGRYRENLAWARAGNLPFFFLMLLAVFLWGARLFGTSTAAVAVTLLAFLPPVLGHAGVATTDLAATATMVAALAAFTAWLQRPQWTRAVLLGLAIGAGLLSKFTFLIYFPCGALVFLAARWIRAKGRANRAVALGQITGATLLGLLVVWAGYRFSVASLDTTRIESSHPNTSVAVAARYSRVEGYEWVRPDLVRRYWAYGQLAATKGVEGVDFADWAASAGYSSPLAGRHGDTLAGAPPLPPPSFPDRALEPLRRAWDHIASLPVPAPKFIVGAEIVTGHSAGGHAAFLLGKYSTRGWWYYFPVVLFFKTPLAFLLLTLLGVVLVARRGGRERNPELIALPIAPFAMLMPPMAGDLNIGVRHVLPLYPLFALLAAAAVSFFWTGGRGARSFVVAVLAWYAAAGAIAHPDYLSYFNEAARGRPELIATDSNLDWGQDLLRLEEEVRRSGIERLYLSYFGSANLGQHDIPAVDLPRGECVTGWIAVSDMHMRFGGPSNRGDGYEWLRRREPVKWVGDSIRLYFVPPGDCTDPVP